MVHTRVRVPGKKKARRTFSNVKCRAQYYGRGESEREREEESGANVHGMELWTIR